MAHATVTARNIADKPEVNKPAPAPNPASRQDYYPSDYPRKA